MIDRIVLSAFCLAALGAGFLEPRAAHANIVVLDDSELEDWEFIVPTGDPEIELEHFGPAGAYLAVRQHHTALVSLKRSIQGSPQAQYLPGASGAVESFSFAGRFRAHYEGVGPAEAYLNRVLQVRAVVRQGGQSFIASRDLFVWAHTDATLNRWVWVDSGQLMESDFRLDGFPEVHPDFSSAGALLTLGLLVSTLSQTVYEEIHPDNTFTVDMDDVRVTAEVAPGEGIAWLSFRTETARLQTTCGALAAGEAYTEGGAGFGGATVQVSQVASTSRPFRMLLDGVNFTTQPPEPPVEIPPGQTSATFRTALSPGDHALLFQLVSGEGMTVGEPSRFALLVREADHCSFSTQLHWREDLQEQGCLPVEDAAFLAATSAGGPPGILGTPGLPATSGITALQALRDQVMATTQAGRYYAELYKTLSPAILRTLVAHPPLLVDLFLSQDAWVTALSTLTEGGANTAQVSADMAEDLNRLLDGFETQGSPALRRTIAHERVRLGLSTISGLTLNQFWQRVNDRWDPEPCVADAYGLCLGGGRYRVESDWATPAGGVEGSGRGRAAALSGDSGYFWFFDPANVEILTKIVDGCGFNQRIWSYSAGLTNLEVELSVFDTATGRGKTYDNPQAASFAPILDGDFLECVAGLPIGEPGVLETVARAPDVVPLGAGSCVPGPQTLCLGDARFRVEGEWRTAAGATGAAQAVPLSADTGTFWFFDASNIELVVKSIDACGLAGFENFWLFAGGTTDVDVTLRVTDTLRDISKTYHRPQGQPFAPILDTAGFDTCP